MDLEMLQEVLEVADAVKAFTPMLHEVVEKYQPVVNDVVGEIVEVYGNITDNPKLYKIGARNKKMRFDAYINSGFTPEQAMSFLLNTSNGSNAANVMNLLARSIPADSLQMK